MPDLATFRKTLEAALDAAREAVAVFSARTDQPEPPEPPKQWARRKRAGPAERVKEPEQPLSPNPEADPSR